MIERKLLVPRFPATPNDGLEESNVGEPGDDAVEDGPSKAGDHHGGEDGAPPVPQDPARILVHLGNPEQSG